MESRKVLIRSACKCRSSVFAFLIRSACKCRSIVFAFLFFLFFLLLDLHLQFLLFSSA